MRTIIKELSWWLSVLCRLGIPLFVILRLIWLIPGKELVVIVIALLIVHVVLTSISESKSKLWDEVDKITFTFIKKVNWDIVLSVLLVVWIIAAVINGIIKSV